MAARKRLVLIAFAVFLGAFALRLVYLHTIGEIGFFRQSVGDGFIYDQRARQIAAGDLVGPADFVHAPLYAYLLGLIQAAVGHDLWAVRLVQMLLGSAACVLLLLACRRFFELRAATLAAVLLAAYPPALFFDGLIQKSSLALFLSTLLLWLLGCCRGRASWPRCLAVGVVSGLLVLARQNALALVPLVLIWLWLNPGKHPGRVRLGFACACVGGLTVALLPWTVRNRVVTGAFVLTTPNLGQNFAMGNHPQGTGTYLPSKRGRSSALHEQDEWVRAAQQATGRTMTAVEVSDYYLHAAWQHIRANPGDWARLMARKWLMVWNAYEAFDTEDYYVYQEWSAPLRILDRVLHFGVLCPLAAAGVVLTWPRRRELWLLYGWLVITALAVAVFVVFARYRLPLVPVLMMFAGAAVADGVGAIRQRRPGRLFVAGTVLALAALASNWTVHHPRRPTPTSYTNHGAALAAQGRFEEDLVEIGKALALAPNSVDAHLAAGNTLVQLGRFEEALEHYQNARAGDPDYAGVCRGLGDALTGLGRFDEAQPQYRRAVDLDPNDHLALNGLATVAARRGRLNDAVELFARVLAIDPMYVQAYVNLGSTYATAGRLDDAAAAYQRALACDPDCVDALFNLGLIELQRGQVRGAIDALQRASALRPDRQDVRRVLAAALARARGPGDEAPTQTP